ncbi:trehalase-domain-containing protein [Paraphysoderma sedebokerense]|nr:trehalase-domain-containing protein [Paraphysoderma sedebokerense]
MLNQHPQPIKDPSVTSSSSATPSVHFDAQTHDPDHSIAHGTSSVQRVRTYTIAKSRTLRRDPESEGQPSPRHRRASHDEKRRQPRRFLIDVEETERIILSQEDTDGDFQITIKDMGPKVLKLGSADSQGYRKYDIRGTYMLSNLLQEIALAKDYNRKHIVIDENRLNEHPVDRLSRMIRHSFWLGLTRKIDADGLEIICNDPKNRTNDRKPRIYIPHDDDIAYEYFTSVAVAKPHLDLEVVRLPKDITPLYVKSLNEHPGILSLGLQKIRDPVVPPNNPSQMWMGIPFIVPGGRFNEMYGWDSYFETLGLLADNRVEMGKYMVDNFMYEIHHYGKILNANRSYYLTRSQPPFLTDMALSVYFKLPYSTAEEHLVNQEWLRTAILYAVKEYYTVWMSLPRYDPKTGLSVYHPTGIGMPPETEHTHFFHILLPYAEKHNMSVPEFEKAYNEQTILEPELDRYFIHDRAVRESGHDTTYRLEKKCADLATVDLNALLYKYEIDIADVIEREFDGRLEVPDDWLPSSPFASLLSSPNLSRPLISEIAPCLYTPSPDTNIPVPLTVNTKCHWETPDMWRERAQQRKDKMNELMWSEEDGLWFDWDCRKSEKSVYESVTALWMLWAGAATEEQVKIVIEKGLPKFEVVGGLVCGTEESRGRIGLDRPNRQWDYPYGWAPHQMMAWRGFEKYGRLDVAKRLAYRWLYTITKSFVDFNGVVPEKFDVVNLSHLLEVEYGNVGVDFKFIPREGFGWVNSSYQVGLTYLSWAEKRKLGALGEPGKVFGWRF